MKVKRGPHLDRATGRVDDDHEQPAAGRASDPELTIYGLPRSLRVLLGCWVGMEAVLVIGLAVWNATLTSSAWDLIGSALLGWIGIACALALGQIVKGSGNALMTIMVSQIFVAGLAIYVWMVDQRSPVSQLLGVSGAALTLGGVALLWMLYLSRYARGAFTKGAAAAVALFPLIGLAQFWMQTDYLPRAARPMIDATAELSPLGSTGPIVHLLAKLTLHNRGSVEVDVHAGLMRVVSYPVGTQAEPATTEALLGALSPLGRSLGAEYRETPTVPGDSRLLYARLFAAPYDAAFLSPGGMDEYQRVIDVDSRTVRLVHMSVDVVAVTHRMMQDTRSCYPPQVSYSHDPVGFFSEAGKLHEWASGEVHALCTESRFASTGAVQDLVSDHPVSRTLVVVEAPVAAVPALMTFLGTHETVQDPFTHIDTMTKVDNANPSSVIKATAEYAPSKADVRQGAG